MRCVFAVCYARAASGQAAATPQNVMNSRRLIGAPEAENEPILSTKPGRLEAAADVRFGSKADIAPVKCDVRFTPKSGHSPTQSDVCFGPIGDIRLFDHLIGA
jgi:hypothetical protein